MDMGTDRLGMRIAVDWDIKLQTIKKNYRILACMHGHTHTCMHATLNCRRVYVLKSGVRQILKKKMK